MRVCIYGGPGSGKSTLAAEIYYRLKYDKHHVELVREFVKQWAYEHKVPQKYDQVYILAQQINREYELIKVGMPTIITDCPPLMSCAYVDDVELRNILMELAMNYENNHNSINFFINRDSSDYITNGRYETLEQAINKDMIIEDILKTNNINYNKISKNDCSHALEIINDYLELS